MKHCWLVAAIVASLAWTAQAETTPPATGVEEDARCMLVFAALGQAANQPDSNDQALKGQSHRLMGRAAFYAGKIWAERPDFDLRGMFQEMEQKMKEPGYSEKLSSQCSDDMNSAMNKLLP
jgi:hypothetical protein